MKQTQQQRLIDHLDSGKSITRLTAFKVLGIAELSSRIGELTAKGYPIQRDWIKVVNRFGENIRVMEYRKERK